MLLFFAHFHNEFVLWHQGLHPWSQRYRSFQGWLPWSPLASPKEAWTLMQPHFFVFASFCQGSGSFCQGSGSFCQGSGSFCQGSGSCSWPFETHSTFQVIILLPCAAAWLQGLSRPSPEEGLERSGLSFCQGFCIASFCQGFCAASFWQGHASF